MFRQSIETRFHQRMSVFEPCGIRKAGRDFFHGVKVIIRSELGDVIDDIE
jgi:hypothetical protein